ncbi:MAG TPA: glycosyltransferase [Candidatus Methylacidiphilales bacterium]|jgi:glycosyltransferase involved in cell wall biosynthesis|nr:glycosyltransferase [Candidatus Methylacidiphilales bacterium]
MKVLVFAHTPPPHHGQSYMVQLMLENVAKPAPAPGELVFYHVNARLSGGMDDVGSWRAGKLFVLFGHILQAWRLRWKYAPAAFYYVPAPAKRSALYRDWLVLLLAAPLFRVRIFHWHAIGLGQWVAEGAKQGLLRRCEAWITRRLFSGKELSLVLNEQGCRDIEIFSPRRIELVSNGIPDPCPDFDSALLPERLARWKTRTGPGKTPLFELLYLAHATRTKGLFDAVDAVALANARFAAEKSPVRMRLTVAGAFVDRDEETAFQARIRQADLALAAEPGAACAVVYAGYVGPREKDRLLRNCDALCFASYFPNEGQPVSIIEALAYGMPVLLSRWRGLPEMVPSALAHLADFRDPASLARAMGIILAETRFQEYRNCYLERYSLAAHCRHIRQAFLSVDSA